MIIPIILVILVGIAVGRLIFNNKEKLANKNNVIQNEINIVSEKVTDDCIEEQNIQEEVETNSQEEKISPNCLLILKKYYEECNHTIKEYVDIPMDLVNKTEKDFESIKHIDENGVEFWYARELMTMLEYSKWGNFKNVINKAKEACNGSKYCRRGTLCRRREGVKSRQ